MKIKRRDFLKLSAATACLGTASEVKSQENFSGWPDRYGMLTDTTLCIGCRSCEEACKKVNNLPNDEDLSDDTVFDRLRRTHAKNYTVVNRFPNPKDPENPIYVKRQCMHCNEPACASACLVGAFAKTPEGPVAYNKDLCMGCRYCMIACPFYIPAYDYFDAYTPQIHKCTMCHDRIKKGQIPACAEACPVEAITFSKRSELIAFAREKIRSQPDRYHPDIFGENEVGGTSWLYVAGTDFANIDFCTELGTTPYPSLTRGFLGVVPLVLTIWPVLLVGFYKFSQSRKQAETDLEVESSERQA